MLRAVPTMRLFGTLTSPYVRRVRVVAHELGLLYEMVDASTEEGQAAMRAVNPTWKVPTVELDGQPLLDSGLITEHLLRHHGPGPLAPHDPDDVEARNLRTVIDGALDSLINLFYLGKDGVGSEQAAYLAKQQERAAAAMSWVEARVSDVWLTRARSFGLAELALCTTVEWMRFRQTYPVERHPGLVRVVEHHGQRESMIATRPPA